VVADAIFLLLRTGSQWKALETAQHGCSGTTAHRHFQEWRRLGVFEEFWRRGLREYDEVAGIDYDEVAGIDWSWQSVDGAMTKAPLGGALRVRTRRTGERLARSVLC
jgi:transposase